MWKKAVFISVKKGMFDNKPAKAIISAEINGAFSVHQLNIGITEEEWLETGKVMGWKQK